MANIHPVPDRSEEVYDVDDGIVERRERVVVDSSAERRQTAHLISQVIWLFFGIVSGLIVIRILLRLIAANPAAPFASFVYTITDVFLWPFYGLTVEPSIGGMVFELSSIIGLIVFALLSWVLVKLVWLFLYREPTRVVQTYERDRNHEYHNDMH